MPPPILASRLSSITARVPHGGSQNPNVNATAKLLEKKREFDAVLSLERATALYMERIEGLAEDCDIMADAGHVCGQVLEQWPKMFEILNLFLSSREDVASKDATARDEGQQLVRVPIEDIQQRSA